MGRLGLSPFRSDRGGARRRKPTQIATVLGTIKLVAVQSYILLGTHGLHRVPGTNRAYENLPQAGSLRAIELQDHP
jgi:hypothetical protein